MSGLFPNAAQKQDPTWNRGQRSGRNREAIASPGTGLLAGRRGDPMLARVERQNLTARPFAWTYAGKALSV